MNFISDQSRRDFLTTFVLGSTALALPPFLSGCNDSEKYSGKGKVPFKVWEEMLQAIMTSSDYLPGRMEELIAAKDVEAMYRFVKDEIILIPNNSHNLTKMDIAIKWGISGVLRCGMATPREKADLLNDMYQKAGVESKVVFERTSIKPEEVPSFFYRPVTRDFNPKISKSQFSSWKNEMGLSKALVNKIEFQKDYTIDADLLSNKIFKTLNQDFKYANEFDFRWGNNNTPTVEFTQNSITKYAHLFDPEVPFGALKNDKSGKIIDAKPVLENEEKIEVEISYRNNIKPSEEIDLVKGTWNATELIGKKISLDFLHGLTLEEQAITPIGSVRTFTPALVLQAIDESEEYMSDRSFLGDAFTIDGKRIELDINGNKTVDGNRIITKPNPELQKKVSDLIVGTSVGGAPIVKVNVYAKDGEGTFLEGLSANDFVITDDGKPIRALMENNQRTPKILILNDASFSMPKEYYQEGMDRFNESLTKIILESYPGAIINFWKTPSSLFTWLLKASQTNYDLIIYATDGDNDDEFNERNRSTYMVGPPAIILNVRNSTGKTHVETFNQMAELTNGKVIDAKDQKKVLKEITNYIDKLEIPPYVFSFASANDANKHIVNVGIDKNRVHAEDTYQFPENKVSNNGIIGIYLNMKIGKNKPVKRVLAGWDPINRTLDTGKNYSLQVQGLLFGGATLAIEGEGPTLSNALCDLLKSKLSNRNWGEAYLDNDIAKASKEFSKGVIHIPAELISLMAPLQDQITEESLTFPSGYRVGLLKTIVGVDENPTHSSFDYLPTSKYVTLANDKTKTFTVNLIKTSQLAIREDYLFGDSTFSLLGNSKLIERSTAHDEKWRDNENIKNLIKGDRFWIDIILRGNQNYKVFDSSAKTKAFWKADKYTGEMYGILYDGTGGGSTRFDTQLNKLSLVINMYMTVIAMMGQGASMAGASLVSPLGGISLGIVAKYGVTLVQLYAIASEAIMIMDASGMDEQVKKALQVLACNVAKEIAYGLTGNSGKIMSGLDNLIGLVVGDEKNPFACK